ncbi:MAG: DUF481 domain-containing protein [Gemmatimonadales bacterium]|nr:MAG: DUF481 domain-containing protein [Gemmatimonadales bacterium]
MKRRPLPPSLLLMATIGILMLPGDLTAQTILNTERFQLSEVEGFHLSASFSMNGDRGNSEVLNIASSGIVGVLAGRHWTRFIFGGKFLSNEERSILDNRFGQVRYSYIFSDRTQSFHFVQAQKNETLRLRSRWLVGSGIRRTVVDGERSSLAVGTGLMGEWERLSDDAVGEGDPTESEALRMANQAIYSFELASGARIINILYFQPDVTDFSDLRVLNDLGLVVPITEHVRLTLSGEWRRDTRPPSELGKDDLTFSMSIGIDRR